MNGIQLCKEIKENYPGIMVLALSTFNQGTYVNKMMESGASGYLLKNAGVMKSSRHCTMW
jgi:DNA-binding NarL/FixJ family response regulator